MSSKSSIQVNPNQSNIKPLNLKIQVHTYSVKHLPDREVTRCSDSIVIVLQ